MKDSSNTSKPDNLAININLDTTPVLYTDNVLMSINEDGLVLDVCQKLANTNQVRVVSRIGMSREHAKKLVKEMSKMLAITEGNRQTGEKE